MKSLLSVVIWAGLIALSGAAMAHDPKEHATAAAAVAPDPATQQALSVVAEFSGALKAGDLDRAGALMAEDVLILESGGAERSRQEYLGGHAKHDAAFLKNAQMHVQQRTARVMGNVAWVGTESELSATRKGKSVTLLSTETMVLNKVGTDWRIVHIHWSSRPKTSQATP